MNTRKKAVSYPGYVVYNIYVKSERFPLALVTSSHSQFFKTICRRIHVVCGILRNLLCNPNNFRLHKFCMLGIPDSFIFRSGT